MARWASIWCAGCVFLIAHAPNDKPFAGGFDRFDQGIDLLFDPSRLAIDISFTSIFPSRKFITVNGVAETVPLGPNSFRPSINAKFVPFEDIACLAAYRQPFGAEIDYGPTWSQARIVVSRSLKIEDLSLTCSYRVPAAGGYIRLIGGVTKNFATYHEEAMRVLPNATAIRPAIDLKGSDVGWRAGFAYEVPARGIRASAVYSSPLDFSLNGTFYQLPLGGNGFLDAVPVQAAASIPQTVEAIVQFPIAPAWLNTVSVKWAEWSIWTKVPVILSVDTSPLSAGRELTAYNAFFRDGWTISNTISHRWSDALTLSLRLWWDRGISTGWTEHTDTWQVNVAANYRINAHLELTGVVGLLILTSGEIDKRAQGGSYDATFDTGTAVSTRVGLRSRI